MTLRYGLFVLGRINFDIDYARALAGSALACLDNAGVELAGARDMLFDNDAVDVQIESVAALEPDGVVVIQATFTDAEAIARISDRFANRVHMWAFPEPRNGGRLRLNAFCGLNLASHALGLRGRGLVDLYLDPRTGDCQERVREWLERGDAAPPALRSARQGDEAGGALGLAAITGAKIGRIGAHPGGFDTCAYDDARLEALADVHVDRLPLDALFDRARSTNAAAIAAMRGKVAALEGIGDVDQEQLDRSMRLGVALEEIQRDGQYSAFSIRCWPETFTEYGAAVCGPVALMGEARVPCACESDVYGAVTSLMLQGIGKQPAFLADIVDMDNETNTGVVWHCGQAPRSMADPACPPAATIHSNRRMPLLMQFALKPGRVTFARISQARGSAMMTLATGEMIAAPPSFSGTSGVVRFDAPVSIVRDRMLNAGIEHHMALIYGDHAGAVDNVASRLGLPVLDLTG